MTPGRESAAVLAGTRGADTRHNRSAQTTAPAPSAQGRCIVCGTPTGSPQEALCATCRAWVALGHHLHRAARLARFLRAGPRSNSEFGGRRA